MPEADRVNQVTIAERLTCSRRESRPTKQFEHLNPRTPLDRCVSALFHLLYFREFTSAALNLLYLTVEPISYDAALSSMSTQLSHVTHVHTLLQPWTTDIHIRV